MFYFCAYMPPCKIGLTRLHLYTFESGAAPAQNECVCEWGGGGGTKRKKLKPMVIISVVYGIRNAA